MMIYNEIEQHLTDVIVDSKFQYSITLLDTKNILDKKLAYILHVSS